MFTWPQIVLLILKIADTIMTQVRDKKQFDAGQDAEIAKVSASVLSKTEYAKNVRTKVAGLDDAAVDKLLRDLEPK